MVELICDDNEVYGWWWLPVKSRRFAGGWDNHEILTQKKSQAFNDD